MSQKEYTLQLAALLDISSSELNELFSNQKLTPDFLQQLKKLKHYYERNFWGCQSASQKKAIVEEYQLLIATIKAVKEGELTSEDALQKITDSTSSRKLDVVLNNIINTCELIFWLTAATTSYAFCIGMGIPLMFFNPALGLAITIGSSILMVEALSQSIECINDFESYTSVNKQDKRERNAVSFFAPPPTPAPSELCDEELDIEMTKACSA